MLQKEINPLKCEVVAGLEGLTQVAKYDDGDLLISAVSGADGLIPTYEAILSGKNIALANKETLVMAGEIIINKAKEKGVQILPIDSEHSAIFQCLQGRDSKEIKKIKLTASGGPFFFTPYEEFPMIDYHKALEHPTWRMGEKVSLDSATFMNKALEVIEAHWLFDFPIEKIEVIIHPESIIHSMVELCDGNVIALLSTPDMRIPISYALTFPARFPIDLPSLNLFKIKSLSFFAPDLKRFPCLRLGYQAAHAGESMPAVLNAANEIALEAFKHGVINFQYIPQVIEKTLNSHKAIPLHDIDDALRADQWARTQARDIIGRFAC